MLQLGDLRTWIVFCGVFCSRPLSEEDVLLLAGTASSFFIADTGLTCCAFAGAGDKADTVVAGSESGVVHFLELHP